ncbi:hypothetical protein EPUL_005334, partial [Erysiphe pulchra]
EKFSYTPAPHLPQFKEIQESEITSGSSTVSREASNTAEMSLDHEKIQELEYLEYLPKFRIEKFHSNGTQDAWRWLMDLKAEFRDHNLRIPAEPSLWVEALFRETDGEAAKWMDTGDATFLEQSLRDKFPLVAHAETTKSTNEMLAEFAQIKSEPLTHYYGWAVAFLRLINVTDRRNYGSRASLSGAEDMVLDMIIKAFVAGWEEDELRLNSTAHGATTTGSLSKTYEILIESRSALGEIQKQLVLHTTKQKAEAFDEISRAPQSVNSVVVRFVDQVPRPPQQSYRNSNQRGGYKGGNHNTKEGRSQKLLFPNRVTSCNPVVNGSKNFTTECTRCGQHGHYSRSCTNPELQKWEQDVLRQIAFPPKQSMIWNIIDRVTVFFSGLLPHESQNSRLPPWPVPPGWKSKAWKQYYLTSDNSSSQFHQISSPPLVGTSNHSSLKSPVCDIDDFVSSENDEPKTVSFQTDSVEFNIHLTDIPVKNLPTAKINKKKEFFPSGNCSAVDLQIVNMPIDFATMSLNESETLNDEILLRKNNVLCESNLLEANLAEARKRRRMDRGDGKEILDDNSSTDDVTHTGNSQPHN